MRALSSTDVPVLLLNQPRVVSARGFVVMTSRYYIHSARAIFALALCSLSSRLSSSSINRSSHCACIPTIKKVMRRREGAYSIGALV